MRHLISRTRWGQYSLLTRIRAPTPRHEGLLVTGPTGTGKSWLACALAHKACRDGRRVLYQRVPRLFEALAVARGDGRHSRALKALARVELLVLHDWGLSVLTQPEREDLLEILEDRHGRSSTVSVAALAHCGAG